ncbi:MAG: hypothetical protein JNL40_05690 [Cyclobacteriaceae bacterium]|nr:hypothetical protein [Cyclobacteriaceae bacterium]
MKTKIILAVLATAAIISFGSTRISKVTKPGVHASATASTGTAGGFAAEDK